jgi:hypothetical protein
MYDKQKEDAAKAELRDGIYQNVWEVISHLVENPGDEEEISELGWVEEFPENHYRMIRTDDQVDIYEVTEQYQDHSDETPDFSFSESEFVQWAWDSLSEDRQAKFFSEQSNEDEDFDCNDPDHREWVFDEACIDLDDAEDVARYLCDQELHWYGDSYTLLEESDSDPEMNSREIYEHWLVNHYVAGKLESVGEKVVEILGMRVWCRTTTGQSFWMDSCMNELGQKFLDEQAAQAEFDRQYKEEKRNQFLSSLGIAAGSTLKPLLYKLGTQVDALRLAHRNENLAEAPMDESTRLSSIESVDTTIKLLDTMKAILENR